MKVETGVDRLIALLNEQKSIKVSEASRLLNIPKEVIQDWADVLEEENIIVIKYPLFSPTLVLKQFSSEEIRKQIEEFRIKKDGLQRRVESALQSLEQHGAGLENFKKTFSELKREVSLEITAIKSELEELERLEEEKKKLNALARASPKAMRILEEARKIDKKTKDIHDKIIRKVASTRINEDDKKRITEKFKAFFEKKNEVNKLLTQLEAEYNDVDKEYKAILEKVKSLDVHDPSMSREVEEMEKHLMKLKKEKESITNDIIRLNRMMVGKK